MNSLLKKQIETHLPKHLQSDVAVQTFLAAVNQSYNNHDNTIEDLQKVSSVNSKELFESNKQLNQETRAQKKIISKLNNVINALKFYDFDDDKNIVNTDSIKLVEFLEKHTNEIVEINRQKDTLVSNLQLQNKELNEYAHMISHDLKSPLQSIDALTSWMEQDFLDKLGDGGKEIIKLIRENVEKMDTLIQGILEYSTIGKTEKKQYPVDLNTLVEEVVLSVENPKDIEINVNKTLPVVRGDFHRLELLFYHLIDNAIKFNNKGENGIVEINFYQDPNYWKFSVKDNGSGIESKYFDKIFVAFQKLENDYKSTGIGLSIVKKIVDVYKGKIWVESTPNMHTIFYFTLKK